MNTANRGEGDWDTSKCGLRHLVASDIYLDEREAESQAEWEFRVMGITPGSGRERRKMFHQHVARSIRLRKVMEMFGFVPLDEVERRASVPLFQNSDMEGNK